MLPNEVFALACRAWYEEQGLVVDERNGEFAHCPYPEGMGGTGYYLLHDHHQQQGILQSKDVDQCCFFTGYANKWLLTCTCWPDNYFDLWDIYEEYASLHAKECAEKLHEEKDELGKSLNAVRAGKEAAKKLHKKKDKFGRSVTGVKASVRLNREKDELGRSLNGVASAERFHVEKDEFGRSVHGVKSAGRTNAQIWESLIDGFRSTAGPVALHNKANGWDPNARIRLQ